jgi:protein-tyrosine phosphatase
MPVTSLNFRDLGGLAARTGTVRQGVLYRSEGPSNFSREGRAALQALEFRAIVDLRSARERDEAPHDWHGSHCRWLGLDVNVDLRVFGNEGRERLSAGGDEAIAIEIMAETYRELPGALLPHWKTVGNTLLEGGVPMLINCTAGKDRTGVAVALLLELVGVPRESILQDYMRSVRFGENLVRCAGVEPGLMQSYGFMPSPLQVDALIGVRPDYLEAAWDVIANGWSGLEAYFEDAGVDGGMQLRIRDLLLK